MRFALLVILLQAGWVTTLVDTLEAKKNISTVFSEWTELAQDRAGWFDLLNADSS